jgi:hemoglobin-like flavoprotein
MLHTERHIVQATWAQVAPNAPAVAALFYGRLFELDPSLRELFAHADMREQGRKLTTMLTVAINSLDRLEELIPAVEALGRRHAGYGVRDEHYDTVGRALLDTLAAGLGAAFTPEARAAWSEVYAALAGVMRRAAEEHAASLRDQAAHFPATARRRTSAAVA